MTFKPHEPPVGSALLFIPRIMPPAPNTPQTSPPPWWWIWTARSSKPICSGNRSRSSCGGIRSCCLPVLFWWTRGRAFLKRQLARRVTIDPAALPYHEPFSLFCANKRPPDEINPRHRVRPRHGFAGSQHVGLFDEVLGSDGKTNLRAANKLKVLTEKFGERGSTTPGIRPPTSRFGAARAKPSSSMPAQPF